MLSDDVTTRDPLAVDARDTCGRNGFFVECSDSIESEGSNSEERLFEYRELLGEMSIFEDDLNASKRKLFNQLEIMASMEHDERVAWSLHRYAPKVAPRQKIWRSKRLAKARRRRKEERPLSKGG